MKVARASLVVLLAALFAATAFSYASSTGQRGVGSGPIEVGVLVSSPTVFPGGLGSADVVIQNDHPFITANVEFNVAIIFSDGMVQPLTGLGSPITLPPGSGLFLGIAFIPRFRQVSQLRPLKPQLPAVNLLVVLSYQGGPS